MLESQFQATNPDSKVTLLLHHHLPPFKEFPGPLALFPCSEQPSAHVVALACFVLRRENDTAAAGLKELPHKLIHSLPISLFLLVLIT